MDYKSHFGRPPVLGKNEEGEETFCSPWCGFGCLKKHHDRAHREADALVQHLNEHQGPGWTKRVWENWKMWHYEVVKGPWQVKITRDRATGNITYKCWFQGAKQIIGDEEHVDPVDAINETFGMVYDHVSTLMVQVQELNT